MKFSAVLGLISSVNGKLSLDGDKMRNTSAFPLGLRTSLAFLILDLRLNPHWRHLTDHLRHGSRHRRQVKPIHWIGRFR